MSIRPEAPPCSTRAGACPRWASCSCSQHSARTLRRLVEADTGARGHRTAGIARRARALLPRRHCRGHRRLLRAAGRAPARVRSGRIPGRLEPPLRTTFAGREILGQSAWTQGPVLMQALGMLAAFDLRALGHNSVRVHPRGDGGAQAGVRRPRAVLRRLARTRWPRSAPCSRRVRCENGRRSSAWIAPRPEAPAPGRSAAPGRRTRGRRRRRRRSERRGRRRRRRHDAHRRDRPRRQHDLPDAERRCVQEVGVRARAWVHAQHAERDVRPRGRPSQCARSAASGRAPRS